jgi:hypothetical protein
MTKQVWLGARTLGIIAGPEVPCTGSKGNLIGPSKFEAALTAGCWSLVLLDEWTVYRTCTGT